MKHRKKPPGERPQAAGRPAGGWRCWRSWPCCWAGSPTPNTARGRNGPRGWTKPRTSWRAWSRGPPPWKTTTPISRPSPTSTATSWGSRSRSWPAPARWPRRSRKTSGAPMSSWPPRLPSSRTSWARDRGVQSGLIAKNRDELDELKRRGERDYFDFDVKKTKQFSRAGPVSVLLNKTDPKRQKYTVTLLANDKRIEKKDKTLLEPVQFYLQGTRHLVEIVVFPVEKDRVVGYISVPKEVALNR